MSHHVRTRVDLAAWGSGAVSPTEFNSLDGNGFKSINGDEGGTWAPSSVIEIGGDGLLMSGPFVSTGGAEFDDATVNGTLLTNDLLVGTSAQFNGSVGIGNSSSDVLTVTSTTSFLNDVTIGNSLADTMFVLGESEFSGTAVFSNDVQIGVGTGEEFEVNADMVVNGESSFVGPASFQDSVAFSSAAITIGGSATMTFGSNAQILGTPKLAVPLLFAATGRVPLRYAELTAATQAVDVSEGNMFGLAGAGVNRTYTPETTGAVAGDFMIFWNASSGGGATDHTIDLGPNPSVTLATQTASLFVFGGTNWVHINFI